MASLVVAGDVSGSVTLSAPSAAGSTVITLPTTSGTMVVTGGAQTVQFAAGSAASPSITFTGDTNTGIFSPTADTIAFSEGGVESMRITAAGNVLMGTTTDPAYSGYTTLALNSASNGGLLDIQVNGSRIGSFQAGSSTELRMFAASNVVSTFYSNGSERMRLSSGGNLGVGTSSPLGKFVVSNGGANGFEVNPDDAVGNKINSYNRSTSAYTTLQFDVSDFRVATGSSATERMRITSGGDVFIGTSTPNTVDGSRFYVYNNGDNGIVSRVDSANFCYVAQTGNGSNNGTAMSFRWTTTQVGRISTTSSATSYVTSSDYRLKEDVAPMTGALAKVALLKPVTYKWKVDGSAGQGFIAHELQEVVPDCVVGEKDAVNEDGSIKPQGIDTSFLVATLTAAIQELNAKVEAQAAEIAALKGAN